MKKIIVIFGLFLGLLFALPVLSPCAMGQEKDVVHKSDPGYTSLPLDRNKVFRLFYFSRPVNMWDIDSTMDELGFRFVFGTLGPLLDSIPARAFNNLDDQGMPVAGLQDIYDGKLLSNGPVLRFRGKEKYVGLDLYYPLTGKRGETELAVNKKEEYSFWFIGVKKEALEEW